jgi:hypothetical protein
METAGICRDSWCSHVIANHESQSHGFHVGTDLLFFFHCQKNISQLMHQHELLLQGPAVQCLLYCAVGKWAVVPYMDTSTSREKENNVIRLYSIGWSCCSLDTPGRYMHCLCVPEHHLIYCGRRSISSDPDLPILSTMRGKRVEEISQ